MIMDVGCLAQRKPSISSICSCHCLHPCSSYCRQSRAHLADGPHHLGSAGEAGSQAVQDSDVLQQLLVGLPVLTVVPE